MNVSLSFIHCNLTPPKYIKILNLWEVPVAALELMKNQACEIAVWDVADVTNKKMKVMSCEGCKML